MKKEQLEEANEAKQVCTANFRKNVSVTGDFGAIIGCDSFSKCHVEATRSVEKLASYASKIDTINGEINRWLQDQETVQEPRAGGVATGAGDRAGAPPSAAGAGDRAGGPPPGSPGSRL